MSRLELILSERVAILANQDALGQDPHTDMHPFDYVIGLVRKLCNDIAAGR